MINSDRVELLIAALVGAVFGIVTGAIDEVKKTIDAGGMR
jgi:hypothetical protein